MNYVGVTVYCMDNQCVADQLCIRIYILLRRVIYIYFKIDDFNYWICAVWKLITCVIVSPVVHHPFYSGYSWGLGVSVYFRYFTY